MPETLIKVGAKKIPDPGKKRWKIITPNNEVFQVNADLAALFAEGKSYKVSYENQEFQGRRFSVIVAAPEEVPEISTGPTNRPSPVFRPRMDEYDHNKQMIIWCCAALKEEIKKGLDARDAIMSAEIVEAQKQVYKTCFLGVTPTRATQLGAKEKEYPEGYRTPPAPGKANAYRPGVADKVDPDLDDDIPY